MTRDDVIAATQHMMTAINTGEYDFLDEICDDHMIDHYAMPHPANEHGNFRQYIEDLKCAFPDLTLTLEHVDATENDMTIIYTLCGTHQGKFLGVEPTGKHVHARGMQVTRFADGKIVERWGSADEKSMFKQVVDGPCQDCDQVSN
jgi:predicted ester cyclase